jgi:hypothetical protein
MAAGWPFGAAVAGTVPSTAPAQANAGAAVMVTVAGDRLSAQVAGASLREMLTALAGAMPLRVTMLGDAAAPVWADLNGIGIEEGIRRLLRGHSYVLVHAPGDVHGASRLVEIVVLGGAGSAGADGIRTAEAAPPAPPAGRVRVGRAGTDGTLDRETGPRRTRRPTDEALDEIARRDPDARRRASALEALGRPGLSEKSFATLTAALDDPEASVRVRALELLRQLDTAPPAAALAWMVRADPSAAVRRAAVTLLGAVPGSQGRDLAHDLLNDPDHDVREQARMLVEAPAPRGLHELGTADADAMRRQFQQTQSP